jgi:hypothetical protein
MVKHQQNIGEIQHLVCFQKKREVETQNNMGAIAVGN